MFFLILSIIVMIDFRGLQVERGCGSNTYLQRTNLRPWQLGS